MSTKKRIINSILAAVMFLTMFIPVVGNAEPSITSGTFTIHKYRPNTEEGADHYGQEVTIDGKYAVPGVGFKLIRTHSFTVENGAIKTVTEESPAVILDAKYTDAEGKITYTDLPLGRYTFQEMTEAEYTAAGVALPTGITIPTAPPLWTVEIPATKPDDGTLFYDVHAYPKNENKEGVVNILKKGTDPSDGTVVNLAGAVFELYSDADATMKITNKPIDGTAYENNAQFTTDAEGKVSISGLEHGKTYYLKEVSAPNGYSIADRTPITVVAGNVDATAYNVNNNKLVKEAPADPTIETEFNYTVHTVVPDDIDNLATFDISDAIQQSGGNYVAYLTGNIKLYIDGVETAIPADKITWVNADITGDVNGAPAGNQKIGFTLNLKDLTAGKAGKTVKIEYGAVLTTASVNQAVTNEITQTIPGSDPTTGTTTITPQKGKLTLTKVDLETNDLLQGAEFQLQKKIGDDWVNIGTIMTTDANGNIVWDNLGAGEYRVVEKKAPTYDDNGVTKNYIIVNENTNVTVATNDNNTVEVANRKGKWYLPGTGGFGYYMFTAVSIGLVVAGLGIYLTKKNKAKAN